MATVPPYERMWAEEEKQAWLAAREGAATHVITFEPLYQVEVCIPPWEHPDRQIARSAVVWGKLMRRVFDEGQFGTMTVVGAHHEGNSLEVHPTAVSRGRLRRVT